MIHRVADGKDDRAPVPLTPWRARGLLTGWYVFQGALAAAFWISVPALLAASGGAGVQGDDHGFVSLWLVAVTGMGLMLFCGGRRFSPYWPRDIAATARAARWPAAVCVGVYGLVMLSVISATVRIVLTGLEG